MLCLTDVAQECEGRAHNLDDAEIVFSEIASTTLLDLTIITLTTLHRNTFISTRSRRICRTRHCPEREHELSIASSHCAFLYHRFERVIIDSLAFERSFYAASRLAQREAIARRPAEPQEHV